MDPLFKRKVRTQAEKTELLRQAREDWNKLGAFQFLVAANDQEYLEKVSESIQVEEENFVAPAPLSGAAEADFSRRLAQDSIVDRVFANRRTDVNDLPPVLQKIADEQDSADLEELLAPARRQQRELDSMIEKALLRAMQKTSGGSLPASGIVPRPVPERAGILPILKSAVEFSENADLVKFLTAYAQGDEAAMRAVARELVAA